MQINNLKNSIIIVDIDSFNDEELPINAIDRVTIYTTKLSKKIY